VECRIEDTGKERAEIMRKHNIKYRPEMFDRKELETMYHRQKLSVKDIALVYGVARNTMVKIMKAHKFKLRGKSEQNSLNLKGYKRSKKFRRKISKAIAKYGHPMEGKKHKKESIEKYKESMRNSSNWKWTEKQRKKASKTWKNKFKNDRDYLFKRAEAMAVKPNNCEKKLNKLLDKMGLNYDYVGDFSYWVGGKNPDFVKNNGCKRIIEMFGRYWHTDEEAIKRKFLFGQYGYQTLIVWDDELDDISKLKNKIRRFDDGTFEDTRDIVAT
jgi:hypothetical protein